MIWSGQNFGFGFIGLVLVALGTHALRRGASVTPSKALKFFSVVGKLKTLKRTGWVNHDVAEPESVADHMYRMAMLSFLIKDPTIDRERLMKICLVHDLAEAIVGDITPYDIKVSKELKRELEENALIKISDDIGDPVIASEIKELWLEYEDCTTNEAKIAKNLDKFEMIIQANEYEEEQGMDLCDFFKSTEGKFDHPEVQSWDELLRSNRKARVLSSATGCVAKKEE